jgi:hypothetical protein
MFIPDPDQDLDFLPIPDSDPGSRGQKGTGSRIRIRNTAFKGYTKNFSETMNIVTHTEKVVYKKTFQKP